MHDTAAIQACLYETVIFLGVLIVNYWSHIRLDEKVDVEKHKVKEPIYTMS